MLNDPHLVSCCGHNFCGPCIKKVQYRNEPCSLCNIKRETIKQVLEKTYNIILAVYAFTASITKKWKRELKDLSSHL